MHIGSGYSQLCRDASGCVHYYGVSCLLTEGLLGRCISRIGLLVGPPGVFSQNGGASPLVQAGDVTPAR